MRDFMAPIINGFDCSGIVNAYSLRCDIINREGENGGLLRDGTQIKDILARKIRLSWTMNSISSAQYNALCYAAREGTVTATVFDPTVNDFREAWFHVTLPAFQFAFWPENHNPMAYAGETLILEEA